MGVLLQLPGQLRMLLQPVAACCVVSCLAISRWLPRCWPRSNPRTLTIRKTQLLFTPASLPCMQAPPPARIDLARCCLVRMHADQPIHPHCAGPLHAHAHACTSHLVQVVQLRLALGVHIAKGEAKQEVSSRVAVAVAHDGALMQPALGRAGQGCAGLRCACQRHRAALGMRLCGAGMEERGNGPSVERRKIKNTGAPLFIHATGCIYSAQVT